MIDVNKLRSAANGAHVTFGDGGGVVVSAYELTALLDMLEAAKKDAARWGMLPAVAEDHQLDLMGLYRDVDAEIEKRCEP